MNCINYMFSRLLKNRSHSLHKCSNLFMQDRFSSGISLNNGPLHFDMVIIGGGIIGCSTARQLKIDNPTLDICLVEKESHLAKHQSGNNSGVIHAGIYYQPGSLKAKLCVKGMEMAYNYFEKNNVPYKKTGKLIVAVEPEEIARLDTLFERATLNECKDIELIEGSQIRDFEPHCIGLKALWSPNTGIVDWGHVTRHFAENFQQLGGRVFVDYPVLSLTMTGEAEESGKSNEYPVVIGSKGDKPPIRCKYLISCTGLHSDRVSQLSGCSPLPKIIPFRGEYLLLRDDRRHLVRGNIYPVPDPKFPFLGVHFTPRINGDVWLGPNAVFAFKREGYRYLDFSLRDMTDALAFRGMHKLMSRYISYGMQEIYRGVYKAAQVKQLRRFIPELKVGDVVKGPTGVRAQAVDNDGNLVDEFIFDGGTGDLGCRILHVRNAPSPGATSSLAIAEMIAEKTRNKFFDGN